MARRDELHTELPYPNGWYAVAFSHDLIKGQVKPVKAFDEDLVVFRTRSGEARILDAYCPHMGAHLGEGGRVMGDTLRCPFHGWQYHGETGQCVTIPYCDTVPERARVRAWDVCEINGMIFLWHHTEQKPPEWEVTVLPEIGDPEWSEPRLFELDLPAHVQDTHENNNDPVHFQVVHGMVNEPVTDPIEYSENGRHYRIVNHNQNETPWGTIPTQLIRDSWCLGLTAVRMEGIPNAGLLMFSSTTPVSQGLSHSRWLLTATNNMIDMAGEEFMKGLTEGVQSDMQIWTNKVHKAQPLFCKEDGSLVEFRKWARQFYTNPV